MRPNVENLCLVELGNELVAEADFQDQRICVRCMCDRERSCWVYHVFLIDGFGLKRISIFPSNLYAATPMGAVHYGLRFAKYHILGVEPPAVVVAPDEFRIWKDSSEEAD